MSKQQLLISLAGLCFLALIAASALPQSPVLAVTITPIPTSTPGTEYTRADLLSRIGAKSIPANTPAFTTANLPGATFDAVIEGASWYNTFNVIFASGGVGLFVVGIIIVALLIFWLSRKLNSWTGKNLSPLKERMNPALLSYLKQSRQDFRSLRRMNRRSRRMR